MLHDDYLCLMESGKQQIKEVRRKFKRKTWKHRQLLSQSGFVLRIAPPPLSRDRRIKMKKSINQFLAVSDKRSSVTKSHESFLSSIDSIESDKVTIYSAGSDILSPHRSKSVDFNRNGSANRDEPPPVATATIIRNTSLSNTPSSTRRNAVTTGLPHQIDDVNSASDVKLTSHSQSELLARRKALSRRRKSDGDVGVSCA